MKTFIALIALLLLASGALACDAFTGHYNPREYPCGSPRYRSCGNGYCCPQDYDCGGPNGVGQVQYPGCPAGACCYNGGQDEGAPPWDRP